MASNYLHYCIKQKLEDVVGGLTENHPPMHLNGQCVCQSDPHFVEEKQIRQEDVVIGALEQAFQECVSDFASLFSQRTWCAQDTINREPQEICLGIVCVHVPVKE